MKHLPKSTPTEILNDPYGFTYKEMSEVIGEDKARALYTELYKQPFHKENLSISTKKVYKRSDTEKYVYELKDNRYIETVFIKRRDGGTVCVSTQVGCSVGCIFCESGRNGFVRMTKRQLVCFGTAALIGVPLFFVLRDSGGNTAATLGMMAVMLPAFFLGMYEKNGQPMEKLLSYYVQFRFLRPKIRPYKTNNYYALLMKGGMTHDPVLEKDR